jgi:hypothetical protein
MNREERLKAADIEKAIATVEDSRRSHLSWIAWYEQHPEDEPAHKETCGDNEWHRRCVEGYDHVLHALRAVADTLKASAEEGWRPIETAPKDGTDFLAYSQDLGTNDLPPFISLCSWHPDAGFCTCEIRTVTHWLPLPSPPITQSKGGGQGMSAIDDIAAERERQKSAEGWTEEHDDGHTKAEMATAAACYILYSPDHTAPLIWPWAGFWWKPSGGRRRNLVKAAALLVAEIERLDRAIITQSKGGG